MLHTKQLVENLQLPNELCIRFTVSVPFTLHLPHMHACAHIHTLHVKWK